MQSPEMDADEQYPEKSGYADFVAEHLQDLEKFASLRDEAETEKFMGSHTSLMLSAEHTGRWFMLRATEQLATPGGVGNCRLESRQLFLMDAACDAANATFMRMAGGDAHASSNAQLEMCATKGVEMLFNALNIPQDPMQLRPKLDMKVQSYIGSIIKRVAKERKRAAAEEEERARRKAAEQRAAANMAAADAAAEVKRKKAFSLPIAIVLVMFVPLLAMAMQQMSTRL